MICEPSTVSFALTLPVAWSDPSGPTKNRSSQRELLPPELPALLSDEALSTEELESEEETDEESAPPPGGVSDATEDAADVAADDSAALVAADDVATLEDETALLEELELEDELLLVREEDDVRALLELLLAAVNPGIASPVAVTVPCSLTIIERTSPFLAVSITSPFVDGKPESGRKMISSIPVTVTDGGIGNCSS